jgi:hypothetical protein
MNFDIPPEMVPAVLGALDNQILHLTFARKMILDKFQAEAKQAANHPSGSEGTSPANEAN